MSAALHTAGYFSAEPSKFLNRISAILPSVNVEMSEIEMDAAAEFARLCGETIPDLMRKLIIRDATLADGYGAEDSSYDFKLVLPPEGCSVSDNKVIEIGHNRIRRILGWSEIRL